VRSYEQDSRESEKKTENIILEEKDKEDHCYNFEVMVFLFLLVQYKLLLMVPVPSTINPTPINAFFLCN